MIAAMENGVSKAKIPDFISTMKYEDQFESYIKQLFDLSNMMQYVENEDK